ncbi:DDRGK domain containing 1 [Rhodnius prolixus]|uniref:DDRGK domain containing 1 n=1 Tax=Rhodnius prolixus TaxID=13249 RepID=UPI003D18E541
MDLPIIFALVSGAIIIVLVYFVLSKLPSGKSSETNVEPEKHEAAGVGRGSRARMRAAAVQQRQEVEEDEDGDHEKMGAKKRAKLEAKAEKKAQREAEEKEREEKKKKKDQLEEERKRQEEREKLEEERKEEEDRKAREEQEKREHEEYLKMKAAFSIEEEGFDENEMEDNSTLLQDFISYIQDTKVINLEDLAARFKLKTQSVIDRIQHLQSDGRLTGVIDDRGKFIYISQSELESVAKFVKQRGRVSIVELVENSQRLINLNPNIPNEE